MSLMDSQIRFCSGRGGHGILKDEMFVLLIIGTACSLAVDLINGTLSNRM